MAETIFRGPGVSIGSLMDGRVEPFDGPSVGYQGDIIANPIFSPQPKDGLSPGRMHGWYNAFYTVTCDAIPMTTASAIVMAAQTPSTTSLTPFALVTAQAGTAPGVAVFAPGVPIVPLGTNSVVTVADVAFGFTTGTTTANNSTVIVVDNRQFTLGQWLVIPGAGATTNVPLFTQVTALGSTAQTTAINVSPLPTTGLSNIGIGQANLYTQFVPPGTQFGPSAVAPNAYEPYRLCGLAAGLDPAASLARNISVSAASNVGGTTVCLVTGYDVYGQLMAEQIQATSTVAVFGKKAFKYVLSIAAQTVATTSNPAKINAGLGDVVGMNFRSDRWEFSDIFYNAGFVISTQGWTAAVTTPASNTTGDVRGAINASTVLTIGASGSATAGGSFDGVKRITVFQNVQFLNAISATPVNYTSVIGVAQATS